MTSITSEWTAADIRRGGYQIKSVQVSEFNAATTSAFGFAVYDDKGAIVYGPTRDESACQRWIAECN